MMTKRFLGVGVFILLMFSCTPSTQLVNYRIVNAYNKYIDCSRVMREEVENGDAKEQRIRLAAYELVVDSCFFVIKEIKPPKELEDFHSSILSVYEVVQNDLIPAYRQLVNINQNNISLDNWEYRNNVRQKVEGINNEIIDLQNHVLDVQINTAKINGYILEEN